MDQAVEVEGRRLRLTNLDKVLYPATGTTKGEVLAYCTAAAPLLLPQLAGRPLTRKRWPHGVAADSFFEKNLPLGTPDWVRRVVLPVPGSTKDRETITFPVIDGLPALVWVANLAALELHVPQWRVDDDGRALLPDRLVIDLDPGEPAGLAECAVLALDVAERLRADGLVPVPVTSGGKGLQLYAAIAGTQDASVVSGYAQRLARACERDRPDLAVSRMTKALRTGKVFLDWSQNNGAKTTIAPWSLRGRERPTVAVPRTWDEVRAWASGQVPAEQSVLDEVLDRLGGACPPGPVPGIGPDLPTPG